VMAPRPANARRNVALGILLLARGRPAGLAQFGDTSQALLASLAPLIAFPLVATVLLVLSDGDLGALSDFFKFICALVTPLVVSFEVARRWGREAAWLHYATAFCWCQWAVPLAVAVLLMALAPVMWLGLPGDTAGVGLLLGVVAYVLWLQWFLARHALELSALRAAGLVGIVTVVTAALVALPPLLAG